MKRIFILLTLLSSLFYVPNALAQSGSRICDSSARNGGYVFEVRKDQSCNWFYFRASYNGHTSFLGVGGHKMTCEDYAKKHFGKPADICQIMKRVFRNDPKKVCTHYSPYWYQREERGILFEVVGERNSHLKNHRIQEKCIYLKSWLKEKVKTAKKIVKKVKYCRGACRKGSPKLHTKTVTTWKFK